MPTDQKEEHANPLSAIQMMKNYWQTKVSKKLNEGGVTKEDTSIVANLVMQKIKAKAHQQIVELRAKALNTLHQINDTHSSKKSTAPSAKKMSPELKKQFLIFDQACHSLSLLKEKFYESQTLANGNAQLLQLIASLNQILTDLKAKKTQKAKVKLEKFFAKELGVDVAVEIKKQQQQIQTSKRYSLLNETKFDETIQKIERFAEAHVEEKIQIMQFKEMLANASPLLKKIINPSAALARKKDAPQSHFSDNSASSHDPHTVIHFWDEPANIAAFLKFICHKNFAANLNQHVSEIIQEMNPIIATKNEKNKTTGHPQLKPLTQVDAYTILLKRCGIKVGISKAELQQLITALFPPEQTALRDVLSTIAVDSASRANDPEILQMQADMQRLRSAISTMDEHISKWKSAYSLNVKVSEIENNHSLSICRHPVSFFNSVTRQSDSTTSREMNSSNSHSASTNTSSPSISSSQRFSIDDRMHPIALELVKKLRFQGYSLVASMKQKEGKALTQSLIEVNEVIKSLAAKGDDLVEVQAILHKMKEKKWNTQLTKIFKEYESKIQDELEPKRSSIFSRIF